MDFSMTKLRTLASFRYKKFPMVQIFANRYPAILPQLRNVYRQRKKRAENDRVYLMNIDNMDILHVSCSSLGFIMKIRLSTHKLFYTHSHTHANTHTPINAFTLLHISNESGIYTPCSHVLKYRYRLFVALLCDIINEYILATY